MTITKRTRFEVLKRDNYTCRYCRATDAELTIDHVVPTALGGSDAPSNLVAACKDCNAGKAASNPDAPLVEAVADDALRWAAAMRQAADHWLADRDAGAEYGDAVARAWDSNNDVYRFGRAWLDDDWVDTAERWRAAGVPSQMVVDAIGIAMRRKSVGSRDVWRYACGIVWTKLTEMQEAARGSLPQTATVADPETPIDCPRCLPQHKARECFEDGQLDGINQQLALRHAGYRDLIFRALGEVVDGPGVHWLRRAG